VYERNGSLEIAVASVPGAPESSRTREGSENAESASSVQRHDAARPSHLVWRVRILGLSDDEILVEQPTALGREVPIETGITLAAILAIGQNRWMFNTRCLGRIVMRSRDRQGLAALRLAMPEKVDRCQRRSHYRVETTALHLPQVELWPLIDPKSVVVAERACEIQYEIEMGRLTDAGDKGDFKSLDSEAVMPEVGPKFTATMLNLGGGGAGLRIEPEDAQSLVRHKLFWMRIALPPVLKTPICATGKLVHSHMESSHHLYAGMAFDFSFNPSHQQFVAGLICRYIAAQQRAQSQGNAA